MDEQNYEPQEAETPEYSADEVETPEGEQAAPEGEEDVNALKAEVAKYKAIAERRSKQLEKVQGAFKEEKTETKKPAAEGFDKVEVLEFKLDHPELRDHIDIIKMVAKNEGISLADAAKHDLTQKILKAEKAQSGVSVINSNAKVASLSSDAAKLRQKAIQSGTAEALAEYLAATAE